MCTSVYIVMLGIDSNQHLDDRLVYCCDFIYVFVADFQCCVIFYLKMKSEWI